MDATWAVKTGTDVSSRCDGARVCTVPVPMHGCMNMYKGQVLFTNSFRVFTAM